MTAPQVVYITPHPPDITQILSFVSCDQRARGTQSTDRHQEEKPLSE